MSSKQPHVMLIFEKKSSENKVLIDTISENHTVFSTTLEDDDFHNIIATNHIHVYITIGEKSHFFNHLFDRYGNKLVNMWIHKTYSEINTCNISSIIINVFFNSSIVNVKNNTISYFVTAYNSGNLIFKPYNSLLKQTYRDWELVIFDDSDDDNRITEDIVKNIINSDLRVKYFRTKHSGFIGEVKNNAARLCKGYVICELDHDDEITEELTMKLNEVYSNDNNVIFVSSNCCELYDDNEENVIYGEKYAFGYGSYSYGWDRGKWRAITQAGIMNVTTIRDIIGVPNHIRTWRTSSLFEIGYNNSELYVADDYELMLRTVIYCQEKNKKMIHLPMLGYYQYRNRNIGNHTFKRNHQIRNLQSLSHKYYSEKLDKVIPLLQDRLIDDDKNIGINNGRGHQHRFDNYDGKRCYSHWEMSWNWKPQNFNEIYYDNNYKVSIVISTYKRPELLIRAINSCLDQTYQNFEIIIVGDKCPDLENTMNSFDGKKDKIMWWNLLTNSKDGGTTPKNYALRCCVRTNLICYLDDDNIYTNRHLETLVSKFKEDSNIEFAFSSMEMGGYNIICREPKKMRVDTSTIMHKRELLEKYGYWRKQSDVGYTHDYEIVSRWVNENLKWKATEEVTMIYNMETQSLNNPLLIYLAYGDQLPLYEEEINVYKNTAVDIINQIKNDKVKIKKSKNAFCLLCIQPNEIWLKFLSKFKNYDLYLMIDNFDFDTTILKQKYNNINFIKINEDECSKSGFTDMNFTIKKRISSWEKAVYYFSKINLNYENIWFCEDDVFIYNEKTIDNIDVKYPTSDLLTNKYEISNVKNDINWIWRLFPISLDPPYYHSMVCICRVSSRLLTQIKIHAENYNSLFFLEALFPTICMNSRFQYNIPDEFTNVQYRNEYLLDDIHHNFLYHPIKDLNKQVEFRRDYKINSLEDLDIINKKVTKNAIYITVFNQVKYVDMLYLLLESIYSYGNLKDNTDILIYTSTEFMNKIKDSKFNSDKLLFEINEEYNDINLACKARLDLFELESVNNYDKILYIDTDIIIKDDLNELLNIVLEDKIYALEEGKIEQIGRTGIFYDYYGRVLFTNEFESYLDLNGFTSGMMLFNNCEDIKNLFCIIKDDIINRPYNFCCYDQPYIVHNCIKFELCDTQLMKKYCTNDNLNVKSDKRIHHFPTVNFINSGGPGTYIEKILIMQRFLDELNLRNKIKYKKFTWELSSITFLDNDKMEAFGSGEYEYIDKTRIKAFFGGRVHIIEFNSDYTNFKSTREGDLQIVEGWIIKEKEVSKNDIYNNTNQTDEKLIIPNEENIFYVGCSCSNNKKIPHRGLLIGSGPVNKQQS